MKNRNKQISEFFNSKAEIYDEVHPTHLLGNLQSKIDAVKYVPETAGKILDLGAGTGLELQYIFEKNKNTNVDCVDISNGMLNKLKEKYGGKNNVNIFCEDYFKFNFKKEKYDCVISIMSFHHFVPKDKLKLYRSIFKTLKTGSVFVYSDYCALDLKEERFFQSELKRLIKNNDPEVYSYDVPAYPETDINLLKKAGFKKAEIKWQAGSTVCIVANK